MFTIRKPTRLVKLRFERFHEKIFEVLREFIKKTFLFFKCLRIIYVVVLTPNSAWGGDGSLGCGIGYGYLHRIPVDQSPIVPQTKPTPTQPPIQPVATVPTPVPAQGTFRNSKLFI